MRINTRDIETSLEYSLLLCHDPVQIIFLSGQNVWNIGLNHIKNIFEYKMDLRQFYFRVTIW